LSQKLILQILESLGGHATITQIREEAKLRYPSASLYNYAGQQLRKLRKWGVVTFDATKQEWMISSPRKVHRQIPQRHTG
jgi:phosphoribosylaminoimidazole carboxylase (NCAIR synthetase)